MTKGEITGAVCGFALWLAGIVLVLNMPPRQGGPFECLMIANAMPLGCR